MTTQKKKKIAYWILTTVVAGMNFFAGVALLGKWHQNLVGIRHLGYPVYFMTILGTAKILGSMALVYKRFSRLTEWAYAGFTFTFLSAAYSHYAVRDSAEKVITPLVILMILWGSYYLWSSNGKRSRR